MIHTYYLPTKELNKKYQIQLFLTEELPVKNIPIPKHNLNLPPIFRHFPGPDVPMIVLMDAISNQRINFLNNNTKLANRYRRMAVPHVKIFEVASEVGYQSQVKLLIPSNFRDYDDLVFPLLLYV